MEETFNKPNPINHIILFEINKQAEEFSASKNKVQSLNKITNLYASLQEKDDKEVALNICSEKVLKQLSPNDLASSEDAILQRMCLTNLLGTNSPAWLNQLIQVNQVMVGEGKEGEKVHQLKQLCSQFSRMPGTDVFDLNTLVVLVSRTVCMSSEEKITLLTLLMKNGLEINDCPDNCLALAMSNNETPLINFFLKIDANVYANNFNGDSPIALASLLKDESIFNEIVENHLQNGCLLFLRDSLVQMKNPEHFLKLLNVLDVKEPNWQKGSTALLINIIESDSSHEEKIKKLTVLKKMGCSLIDTSNRNLLSVAYGKEKNDIEKPIFKFLLDEGLDVHKADKMGNTPLQLVLRNEDKKTIFLLIEEFKIKVEEKDLKKGFNLTAVKFGAPQKTFAIKLLKAFKEHKDFADKLTQTKLVSHSFSLGGSGVISKKESVENELQEEMIKLEGTAGPFKTYKELGKSIEQSQNSFNKLEMKGCREALKFSSQNPTSQKLLQRFNTGEWTLIGTGYKKHSVTVALKKDALGPKKSLFVICNRGEGQRSDKPVESFVFTGDHPSSLLSMIEKMLALRGSLLDDAEIDNSLENYTHLMFKEIPQTLDLKETKETQRLNLDCVLENQTVGNCTYAGGEMAAKMMIYFDTSKGKIFSQKATLDREFEKLRCLTRLKHLNKYLKIHAKEDFPYKIDSVLVGNALSILWSSSSVQDRVISHKLKEIEKTLASVIDKNHLLIYKTSKSFEICNSDRLKTGNLKEITDKDVITPLLKQGSKVLELLENNLSLLNASIHINALHKDFENFTTQLTFITESSFFDRNEMIEKADLILKQINVKYQIILEGYSVIKNIKNKLNFESDNKTLVNLENDFEKFLKPENKNRRFLLDEIKRKYK